MAMSRWDPFRDLKGVLTIEVPKAEEARPKKITIKAAG